MKFQIGDLFQSSDDVGMIVKISGDSHNIRWARETDRYYQNKPWSGSQLSLYINKTESGFKWEWKYFPVKKLKDNI